MMQTEWRDWFRDVDAGTACATTSTLFKDVVEHRGVSQARSHFPSPRTLRFCLSNTYTCATKLPHSRDTHGYCVLAAC
jgi:hypothetical protein